MPITIFISHASADKDLAEALIRLLRAALNLRPDSIRCTSVLGFRLPTGAEVDTHLRDEVLDTTTFIALLTKSSLDSTFVLFELGARWGAKKPLFSLMSRGVTGSQLDGPLRAINARDCSAPEEIYQFLGDVAASLGVEQFSPQTYQAELRVFIDLALIAPPQSIAQEVTPPKRSSQKILPIHGPLDMSAREICGKLRDAVPLQVAELAKRYAGHEIDWETTLSSAYPPANEGLVDLHLNPWETEGYDICIHCSTTLEKNPELASLQKNAKLRLQGRILKAGQFDIYVEVSKISVMSNEEINGTRVRFLVRDIRNEFGIEVSQSILDKAIEDCIKAQVRMGRPDGLSLVEDKKIVPQISPGSNNYKLLVLYTTLQLIQSSKIFPNKQRQDRAFKIESEIHELENGSMFLASS